MVIIEDVLDGEPIEIAIHRDGSFEFLNYDIDEDIIAVELGDEPSEAWRLYQLLEDDELYLAPHHIKHLNNGLLNYLINGTHDNISSVKMANFLIENTEWFIKNTSGRSFGFYPKKKGDQYKNLAISVIDRAKMFNQDPTKQIFYSLTNRYKRLKKNPISQTRRGSLIKDIIDDIINYMVAGPRESHGRKIELTTSLARTKKAKLKQLNRYMDYLEASEEP